MKKIEMTGKNLIEPNVLQFLTQKDFNEILQKIIKSLPDTNYEYLSGGEGRAYFIDDNFVLKEYRPSLSERVAMMPKTNGRTSFEEFIEEMQQLWEAGLSVPRFYAGAIAKLPRGTEKTMYILQERVKGESLYQTRQIMTVDGNNIDEIYENFFMDQCTPDEFEYAIRNQEGKIYVSFLNFLVSGFLNSNKGLASSELSDEQIINYILTHHDIEADAKHLSIDTNPRNTLLGKNKLALIDPFIEMNERKRPLNAIQNANENILQLFSENANIYGLFSSNRKLLENDPEFMKLYEENKTYLHGAIKRFMRLTNTAYSEISPNWKKYLKFDFLRNRFYSLEDSNGKYADEDYEAILGRN